MNPRKSNLVARFFAALMLFALLAGFTPVAYAAPGDLTRVSVDTSGAQGNGRSYQGQLSGDGRYVAFASGSSNMVADDTNGVEDVFVKDRQTGETTRVSLASLTAAQTNSDSGGTLDISSDGRYVAFESNSTNLVAVDANGQSDIFVRDRQAGTTTLVSVDSSGNQANDFSENVSISTDGRVVAFMSSATNLVSGDANATVDVFAHDIQTGVTTLVSVSSAGVQGSGSSFSPQISANGRFVVFSSNSNNLVSGDTNGVTDIFVHDLQSGQTTRESVNSSGEQILNLAEDPSISGDGRYVAFSSASENLMSEDTLGFEHLYVHDRQTGTTTLASTFSDGYPMQGRSDSSAFSAEGRYIAFSHDDRGDSLPDRWIYIHDRISGQTVKTTAAGPIRPYLSADGRFLAYDSSNPLVTGDTNGQSDVFVKEAAYAADVSPRVLSVEPTCSGSFCRYPSGPNASFKVIFSESVTGVTADDFSLTMNGGISGTSITSIRGSRNTYLVTVNAGTGDGTLRLDVLDDDSIKDPALNPLAGAGNGNGNFNTGELYIVDNNLPVVTGLVRFDPNPTAANSVHFTVNYSEEVSGVDISDFTLSITGAVSGAAVAVVSGAGKIYTVTVNAGTGDGTLRLDLIDNDSIVDAVANPLGGAGAGNGSFTSGETYIVDKNSPAVTSSLPADPNPTAADSVHFTVNFSEDVSGVDAGDFSLSAPDGISGASVSDVSGSGAAYIITINTGSGDGTLRLDVVDNDSIVDATGKSLGGAGASNGNFSSGGVYTIDKATPSVVSILRADPNPTSADSVRFSVNFSEFVSGVDAGDFSPAITGTLTGVSVLSVSGSGKTYTVTVADGIGTGDLRLGLVDNDSIIDIAGKLLGGAGADNGSFNLSEIYTVDKTPINIVSETFRSTGANDGWVVESTENSNKGGSRDSNGTTFNLGDDVRNRQYRAILHFPTDRLPDNAVVTQVILMITKQGVVGTDPFTTHQNISIDIRSGVFGGFGPFSFRALQASDFQAPASMLSVGVILNNPVGNSYWSMLDPAAHPLINLVGVTQFRLGFQIDDNNDRNNDFIKFFSGNYRALDDRPQLLVRYSLPK